MSVEVIPLLGCNHNQATLDLLEECLPPNGGSIRSKQSSFAGCCESLPDGDIYMVLKSDRFIGFFNTPAGSRRAASCQGGTPRDKSFEIHVYPRACPMSAKTILRCALLHTMREGEDILFSTYHPTLVTTALYLLPDMKVVQYSPSDIECSYKANKEVYKKLTLRMTADTEVGYAVFV